MARLLIHVEGQTEEGFVNEVLRDHLVAKGYHAVEARIVGNARLRERRGGIRAWPSVRMDIARHLKEDPGCVATTLVDYYGLPQGEGRAWPGRSRAATLPAAERARCVEDAVLADLTAAMGSRFDARRFIPFVVMHEFEGLLFSDCAAFSRGIGRPDLESGLQEIRDQFAITGGNRRFAGFCAVEARGEARAWVPEAAAWGTGHTGDWVGAYPGRVSAFRRLARAPWSPGGTEMMAAGGPAPRPPSLGIFPPITIGEFICW